MATSAFNLSGGNSSIDLLMEAEDGSYLVDPSAKTISIDLSKYDYVMAEAVFRGDTLSCFNIVPVGDTSNVHFMQASAVRSNDDLSFYAKRTWQATKTGITFGVSSYRGSMKGEGAYLYVSRIYGIKSKNIISGKF